MRAGLFKGAMKGGRFLRPFKKRPARPPGNEIIPELIEMLPISS
jgi:hypothetical protein